MYLVFYLNTSFWVFDPTLHGLRRVQRHTLWERIRAHIDT